MEQHIQIKELVVSIKRQNKSVLALWLQQKRASALAAFIVHTFIDKQSLLLHFFWKKICQEMKKM
ncbi:uncharacterized protein CCR75_008519 [Bremia lactucae]|uniref:Uncharacterized protein n=1 Tax=Bremia lactucae TaxID=4779 RepID=A0A976IKE2_BRELC|nr:hypothetical protein CCR75_008519 [Bremia lactucae]